MKSKYPIAVIGVSTISSDEVEGLSCGAIVRLNSQAMDLVKLIHDGEVLATGVPVVIDNDIGIRVVKVFNRKNVEHSE